MAENKLTIPINLLGKEIELSIYGDSSGDTLQLKQDAPENGESPYQIKEGCQYEYVISDGFCLAPSEIVSQSKVYKSSGRISPNIYVGTLALDVLDSNRKKCCEVRVEVQSVKTSYREDYRLMLEEITEKCNDLLLQHSSPVSQNFEVDFGADANTLYQRFAFVKSILDSIEFNEAIHKILTAPVTTWKESEIIKDIRSLKRFNNSAVRQLTTASNRLDLPLGHSLRSVMLSVPSKIRVNNRTETVDTPENRFIKHALVSFQTFCIDFSEKLGFNTRVKLESGILIDKLEQLLGHSIFKEISIPTMLPLNSPILQRKEGYREILRIWLMFDLAAKMVWHGGDDVYSGNKRDVATLYEYWLFFKLLDIVKEVFKIEAIATEKLIEQTSDGLGLKLKQGIFLPVEGVFESATRKLRVEFSYNKTFTGGNEYPGAGSWTRSLRPDYTLTVWPFGIEKEQAELEELIVHIHFDAKYKVEDYKVIFGNDDDLIDEKREQEGGNFKRVDLLKMHTYRDAIRRTAGAYVLYPGTVTKRERGFHELLPGLGAFPMRPSKTNNGSEELKKFLNEVVEHFLNRTSQRESIALKSYQTYKDKPSGSLNELLPEAFGANRGLIPDETYVLVGYYKKQNLDWIISNKLYNARAGDSRGSLRLGLREVEAKYLLLHSGNETITNVMLKIVRTGPMVISRDSLVLKGYPTTPTQEFYLAFSVEELLDVEFMNQKWDISLLAGYKKGSDSFLPFTVTLSELMKVKCNS